MTSKQIYNDHIKPVQGFLPIFNSLFPDITISDDPLLKIINEFVDDFLDLSHYDSFFSWNSSRYPVDVMLKAALFSFASFGYMSVRKQAELYSHDVRILSFFNGHTPSFKTIHNFQTECLCECMEDIFTQLNLFIESRDSHMDKTILYLDGTKLEANANKRTFVWMKAVKKYKSAAWKQMIQVLEKLNGWLKKNENPVRFSVLRSPEPEFLFAVEEKIVELEQEYQIPIVCGKGHRKHELQKLHDRFVSLAVRLFKYWGFEELAEGRNSFSKTDPDATFMHMKYDYYNNTNVFKPGYNVQVGVSDGYIRVVHVSSNCNDLNDFIPTLERYEQNYGALPESVPADAGYGCFENYSWCREHGIELMMKYSGQNAESKITDKNRFRSYAFGKTETGIPVCPAGHEMELLREKVKKQGGFEKKTSYYGCSHCQECPLRSRCTKSSTGRKLQICHEYENMKEEVKENMSTDRGHRLMVNRSIQAEGAFGDIKKNFGYDRLRRRGMKNVEFELFLVACGHNLRKFANRSGMSEEELQEFGTQKLH